MAEQDSSNQPKKLPRIRGQNFSTIEVNLISQRVVDEMSLLRGKFGNNITAEEKNKMWEKITAEVNALGVSFRNVNHVRTKFRNLTRDAKEKFTFQRKEMNRTGGGPAPKAITSAEENIINAMKDTSSFKGIDGGLETSVTCIGVSDSETTSTDGALTTGNSDNRPTNDNSILDQTDEPVILPVPVPPHVILPVPVQPQNATSINQTAEEQPSTVEEIWIRRLEQIDKRNEELALSSVSRPASQSVTLQTHTCNQQPPKASDSKRMKKDHKKTAEDVYELQCRVLENDIKRIELQMELFQKQIKFYDMLIQKKTLDSNCNLLMDVLMNPEV